MKKCPRCGQTYSDKAINFCLNDGELLSYLADDAPQTLFQNTPSNFVDDSPQTEFLEPPRATSETNWPQQASPVQYQSPEHVLPMQQFAQYPLSVSPSPTLAIVALGLGIGSMTVGWCCYSGLLLSPVAIVTGIIALSQIRKNPDLYSGRGLAIAGVITGAAYLAIILLIVVAYIVAMIAGNM